MDGVVWTLPVPVTPVLAIRLVPLVTGNGADAVRPDEAERALELVGNPARKAEEVSKPLDIGANDEAVEAED